MTTNVVPTNTVLGMSEALSGPERTLRAAHFLRQSIITRRKLVVSINRNWCQNQQDSFKKQPWIR